MLGLNLFRKSNDHIDNIIEELRRVRQDCARDPESVLEFWPKLRDIESRLSEEEKWTVIEQFCTAAMDLNEETIYRDCLKRLHQQFPDSNRVKILDIIANYELAGDFEEAARHYDSIIEDDDTNISARKRKIAILTSQKKSVEAIKELCDYLKTFMNDQDAWKELCELYMVEQDYSRAIFCMEELLLSNPMSHVYHTRLAEMHYTLGTHESLELARSYYAQALKLNETNVRALHGLHLTLKHLLDGNKITAQQRKEYEKLNSWATSKSNSIYDKDGDPNVSKHMRLTC